MIEMPFHKWSGKEISEILNISLCSSFSVILAHIERYLNWQDPDTINRLLDAGVFIQSNAEFFIEKETRNKALSMLKDDKIHILGSDTHNTDTRPQMIGEAKAIIKDSLGEDAIEKMLYHSKTLLDGALSIDQMGL